MISAKEIILTGSPHMCTSVAKMYLETQEDNCTFFQEQHSSAYFISSHLAAELFIPLQWHGIYCRHYHSHISFRKQTWYQKLVAYLDIQTQLTNTIMITLEILLYI